VTLPLDLAEMAPSTRPPREPSFALSNISKRFPGVRALSGVSLDLYPGEVVALIGENGAGKSTLVKIMTGILQPSEGSLLLDGRPVTLSHRGLPPSIRRRCSSMI
jgi:rhamnose transport system ATP-binding protein